MPFDGTISISPEVALLDRMADILSTPDKWCKGRTEVDGRYCIYGALNIADHNDSACLSRYSQPVFLNPAAQRVSDRMDEIVLRAGYSFGEYAASLYNDLKEVTHENILSLIKDVRETFEAEAFCVAEN
jgi:hypothetical protein